MINQRNPDDPKRAHLSQRQQTEVAEWLEALRSPESSELPLHPSLLFFRHAGKELALPASFIGSVALVGFTHRVPHRESSILKGLAASNGELVPLIELANTIGLDPNHQETDRVPRLLVMTPQNSSGSWATIVDMVHGVEMSDPTEWTQLSNESGYLKSNVKTSRGTACLINTDVLLESMEAVFQ